MEQSVNPALVISFTPGRQAEAFRTRASYHPGIVTGVRKQFVLMRMKISLAWRIFMQYPNPVLLLKLIRGVRKQISDHTQERGIKKLVKVDGKYFISLTMPGWPSAHFYRGFLSEAKSMLGKKADPSEHIRLALVAMTKKCPLRCEHCFEWAELNKKETLSDDHLRGIILKLQDAGVPQIQLSGGEPLARIHTLLGLLQNSKGDSDFWISTSGFNLTEENALRLKNAGLTGVAISLDHFDAGQHDRFRGYEGAFAAATEGAVRAKKAGLVVALALVPTREFCTEGNLTSYMELAARLGVDFVQLIEPRAVGHYAGKDVELKPAQERVLEDFFTRMNNDPFFAHLPLVHYYGMKQRRMGCAGSGHKYIYVDTDGAMSSCPYCRRKQVSLLDHSLDDAVLRMKEAGCVKFAPVQLM